MMATVTKDEEHEAVTNFRKYLRIKSVHPDIDYGLLKHCSLLLNYIYLKL